MIQLLETPVFSVARIASDGTFQEVQPFITLPLRSLWGLLHGRWHKAPRLICNHERLVSATSFFESICVNNPGGSWSWSLSFLLGDSGVGVISATTASSVTALRINMPRTYIYVHERRRGWRKHRSTYQATTCSGATRNRNGCEPRPAYMSGAIFIR